MEEKKREKMENPPEVHFYFFTLPYTSPSSGMKTIWGANPAGAFTRKLEKRVFTY